MEETLEKTTRQMPPAPKEAWDAIAADYDAVVTTGEAALPSAALRLAGLRPGDRFLDVAAGSGRLSLPALRLGARVVATDWAPKMIERFTARVRQEGLAGAEGRVMDCHALEFADDSFDVAGSQFGVMLVPDQPQALREMVRVTRPGGRVVVVAFGSPAKFEALQLFLGALRAVVPGFRGLPADAPPLEFQVSDPQILQRRLEEAGLREVSVDTSQQETMQVRSGRDLWRWCLASNPIPGALVADVTDEQKEAAQRELERVVRERAGDADAAIVTAAINIGVGTK